MQRPENVDLDWSASERYRVEGMLEAAVVGSPDAVRRQLLVVDRRLAPDEVMAMTDLADTEATLRSDAELAVAAAAVAEAGTARG